MGRYLVATDSVQTSSRLISQLKSDLDSEDTVIAVNSIAGRNASNEAVRNGEKALAEVEELLAEDVPVETHQLIQDNTPATDILELAREESADWIVIGIKKRSPVGKVAFGSTAQDVLLATSRPVAAIPITD